MKKEVLIYKCNEKPIKVSIFYVMGFEKLILKFICKNNKCPLYCAIWERIGKNKKMDICITDSLCYTPETNTVF